ncbi:MAG TPA: chemotaxis protein CheW [Cyclobacteriaceae bacterium]
MTNESTSSAYLTFMLGDEKFAIPVSSVQEIVELDYVTKVPQTPDYMLGIINLRGKILPLLDTRLKLGLPSTERTKKNRILILDIQETAKATQVGAIVDVAREVVEIDSRQIQKSEDFEHYKDTTPITGIVNNQGDITMIMDIARVFSVNDLDKISQTLNK